MSSDYRAIFDENIARSVQRLLTKVDPAAASLPTPHQTQALHTLSYAFKVPRIWPQIRQLLLAVAPQMEQAGHREVWLPYLERGIALSRQQHDVAAEAELRLQVGILYQRLTNYEAARHHLEISAAYFASQADTPNQVRVRNQLAYVARLQRRFDEAEALVDTIFQLTDATDPKRAYGYYVLSLVALDKRLWSAAINFSKRSFDLWQRENNRRMMGRSLISRGAALHRLEDHQAAIAVYQQALTFFEAINDPVYQAIVRMNLGNVYITLDQPSEALDYYLPAEKLFRRIQDRLHLAMINHNLGMAYHQLQQWDRAEVAYSTGLEIKKTLGNIASLVNTLSELGETYLVQNRSDQALAIFDEALDWLEKIKQEPGYDYLFALIISQRRNATV